MVKNFTIEEYNYDLPEGRIAKHPLQDRAQSKLLVWNHGKIMHSTFAKAPESIPNDSTLVFNDTKVIAARLLFRKSTGAQIEIFLLHPELPTRDISTSMTLQKSSVWLCMIGNKKKWKDGTLTLKLGENSITASYHNRDENLVHFEWTGGATFADIINQAGETPLPPYLKRKPVEEDSHRYQTVYSKNDGAVAAPTAGLHFTNDILTAIKQKGIALEYLTLHVSAGTFKPVEASDYRDHDMHCEQILVTKQTLENLKNQSKSLIAVGTTSLRILESLYWYGCLLAQNPDAPFFISKTLPYENSIKKDLNFHESLDEIIALMERKNLSEIHGETEIFIYPGYQIRTARGLFTNFHLPKSTLLLLISAFVGDGWKDIYKEALANNYRFLSYGDSSLLLR